MLICGFFHICVPLISDTVGVYNLNYKKENLKVGIRILGGEKPAKIKAFCYLDEKLRLKQWVTYSRSYASAVEARASDSQSGGKLLQYLHSV